MRKKREKPLTSGTEKSVSWSELNTLESTRPNTPTTSEQKPESIIMPNPESAIQPRTASVGRTTDTSVTQRAGSLTPYPNIDEAQSPSTNLIDDTTMLLREQMTSLAGHAKANENHFGTVQQVNAICACAKNINALLRTKLDIYKAYQGKK